MDANSSSPRCGSLLGTVTVDGNQKFRRAPLGGTVVYPMIYKVFDMPGAGVLELMMFPAFPG